MNEFETETYYGYSNGDDSYSDIIITDEYGREVGRYSGSAAKLKFPLKLKQSDVKISGVSLEDYHKEYNPVPKPPKVIKPKFRIEHTERIIEL